MNLIPIVYAAETVNIPELDNIIRYILNPIITFLFALALVYFFYGVFKFIANSGNDAGKKEGKSHMLWGVVGLAIMVSVYGLLNLVVGTILDVVK